MVRGSDMRRGLVNVAGFAAVAGVTVAAGVMGLPVAQAGTAVNWTARTCAAEQAFVRHATSANLDAMLNDSEHVAWKYVGEDASGLYADVRGGKSSYVAKDEKYFAEDC